MKTLTLLIPLLFVTFIVSGQKLKDSTVGLTLPHYSPFNVFSLRGESTNNNSALLIGFSNQNDSYTHVMSISNPDSNHMVIIHLYPSQLHKINDSTYSYKQQK